MIVDLLFWALLVYALIQLGAFIQRMKYEMELDDDEEEEDEEPIEVVAMIEYHNGVMYAYDESKFLGQGETMEILEQHIVSRVKDLYNHNVRIIMMTEDKDLITRYNLTPI